MLKECKSTIKQEQHASGNIIMILADGTEIDGSSIPIDGSSSCNPTAPPTPAGLTKLSAQAAGSVMVNQLQQMMDSMEAGSGS